MLARPFDTRAAAALILAGAVATIGGAYVFQYGLGYIPCHLCLIQRTPYYVAMAVALVTLLMPRGSGLAKAGIALLGVIFLVSAGLGIFHSGVEWSFWAGPADCAGGAAPATASVGDLMKSLQGSRIVSCTEAAWRFLGLSLAGWNVLISLALVLVAAAALRPAYGSSSLSQYR